MPADVNAWQARLARALDVGAVLQTAQEFLAEWTVEELSRLPFGCLPPPMTHADEVSGYALTLLQFQYKHLAESGEMETMSAFFATASTRLSEIFAEIEAVRRNVIRTSPHFNLGDSTAV